MLSDGDAHRILDVFRHVGSARLAGDLTCHESLNGQGLSDAEAALAVQLEKHLWPDQWLLPETLTDAINQGRSPVTFFTDARFPDVRPTVEEQARKERWISHLRSMHASGERAIRVQANGPELAVGSVLTIDPEMTSEEQVQVRGLAPLVDAEWLVDLAAPLVYHHALAAIVKLVGVPR